MKNSAVSKKVNKELATGLKKLETLKVNLQNLRIRNFERLSVKRRNSLVTPLIPSRYDEVYFEGLKWLGFCGGENMGSEEIENEKNYEKSSESQRD